MNRYQLEVTEMDRRHRATVRVLTFVGAAVLIIATLWSAGLPPTVWFDRLQQFVASLQDEPQSKPVTAAPMPPPAAVDPAQPKALDNKALAGTDSSISPTPLPLYLISTSPGRNTREGTAALGVDLRNPQTYGAGAILANGARLAEIHADYVVLERGGKSTRLYRQGTNQSAQRKYSDELILVGGVKPPSAPVVNTREVITDYLRPSPVYDGEILQGYVVYPGRRSGVFSQLGLQSGDVIVALNDAPLSDPTQAYESFRQLTTGIAMTATVKRKGKTERLALDGAHIVADLEREKNAAVAEPVLSPPGMPSM